MSRVSRWSDPLEAGSYVLLTPSKCAFPQACIARTSAGKLAFHDREMGDARGGGGELVAGEQLLEDLKLLRGQGRFNASQRQVRRERTLLARKALLLQGERERALNEVQRPGRLGDAHPEHARLAGRTERAQAGEAIGEGLAGGRGVLSGGQRFFKLTVAQSTEKGQRQVDTGGVHPAQIRQEKFALPDDVAQKMLLLAIQFKRDKCPGHDIYFTMQRASRPTPPPRLSRPRSDAQRSDSTSRVSRAGSPGRFDTPARPAARPHGRSSPPSPRSRWERLRHHSSGRSVPGDSCRTRRPYAGRYSSPARCPGWHRS